MTKLFHLTKNVAGALTSFEVFWVRHTVSIQLFPRQEGCWLLHDGLKCPRNAPR